MPTIDINSAGEAHERHDIVPSVSIDALLRHRDDVLARLNQAAELVAEASHIAGAAHLGFPLVSIAQGWRGDGIAIAGDLERRNDALALARRMIDAEAWRYLLHESGMRSLMSASKREEFEKALRGPEVPALTRDAIYATFGALHQARGEMFEQGVIECFRRLSWHYKTNLPQKFGKRIVVTYLHGHYYTHHNAAHYLDDLMRVFHIVDGKPEPDHRQGCYGLVERALRDQSTWPKQCENDYIAIRLFKNRNGHVTFKRSELVDQLNRIIAKHYPNALPEPR
jgi:Domain of unknown function (DUF4942)